MAQPNMPAEEYIRRYGPHISDSPVTGWLSKPDPDKLVKTHCCFCGMQCGIQLAVTDSGPGIPEEFAQKIFDRFSQVPGSEAGTAGLGLSLAAQIAAVHGGELRLANPGQPAACFECRLPPMAARVP